MSIAVDYYAISVRTTGVPPSGDRTTHIYNILYSDRAKAIESIESLASNYVQHLTSHGEVGIHKMPLTERAWDVQVVNGIGVLLAEYRVIPMYITEEAQQ